AIARQERDLHRRADELHPRTRQDLQPLAVIPANAAVIPANAAVIPANAAVIPANAAVIPAKAGIQPWRSVGHDVRIIAASVLDSRFRGNDGARIRGNDEAWRDAHASQGCSRRCFASNAWISSACAK